MYNSEIDDVYQYIAEQSNWLAQVEGSGEVEQKEGSE